MFGKIYSITSNVIWNRRPEYYKEEPWRGTLELDGGALATQASHFVDMMQWIGGKVKSVFPIMFCEQCQKESIYPHCEECDGETIKKYH